MSAMQAAAEAVLLPWPPETTTDMADNEEEGKSLTDYV